MPRLIPELIQVINKSTKRDLLPECKKFRVRTNDKSCQTTTEEETRTHSVRTCNTSEKDVPESNKLDKLDKPRWMESDARMNDLYAQINFVANRQREVILKEA